MSLSCAIAVILSVSSPNLNSHVTVNTWLSGVICHALDAYASTHHDQSQHRIWSE